MSSWFLILLMFGGGDAIERGRQIYLTGKSPSGAKISAWMDTAGVAVPATLLPCASCHGRDGKGRPEGGVYPADLRRSILTKPYKVVTAGGRERGPYDHDSLKRAVSMGKDSSGNELNNAMPRYRMSHADMEDLLAFMDGLGAGQAPGISEDRLHLGVLLPPEPDQAGLIRKTLEAYTRHLNQRGGLYSRSYQLHFLPLPAALSDRISAIESFLEEIETFALISSCAEDIENPLAALLKRYDTPLLGAWSPYAPAYAERYVFYLDGGLRSMGQALAAFASNTGKTRAAILYRADQQREFLARTIIDTWTDKGFSRPLQLAIRGNEANIDELLAHWGEIDVLFYLGLENRELEQTLFARAHAAGYRPRVMAPSSFSGPELLHADPTLVDRLFLGLVQAPADRNLPGKALFRQLTTDFGMPAVGSDQQWLALASLYLFHEMGGRVGRDLDRDRFIEALEGIFRFETGLAAPVSFRVNQRIGATGGHIYRIADGSLVRTGYYLHESE